MSGSIIYIKPPYHAFEHISQNLNLNIYIGKKIHIRKKIRINIRGVEREKNGYKNKDGLNGLVFHR